MLEQGRWSRSFALRRGAVVVHLLRRCAGIAAADERLSALDMVDGVGELSLRRPFR